MSNRVMCAVAVLVGCGGVSQIDDSGDSGFGGSPQADVVIVATTVYVSVPLLSGGSATVTAGGAIEVVDATGGVTSFTTTQTVAGGSHIASSSLGRIATSGGSRTKAMGGSPTGHSSTTSTGNSAGDGSRGGSSHRSSTATAACRDTFQPEGTCTVMTTSCGWNVEFVVFNSSGVAINRFGCGDGLDGDSCKRANADTLLFATARCVD